MRIAVIGFGTVGETLAAVLLRFQRALAIDELIVVRRAVAPWDAPRMHEWAERGASIVTRTPGDGFEDFEQARRRIDFVFDCGPNGHALSRRDHYETWIRADEFPLTGVVAQGSETGFGAPFMSGVGHTRVRWAPFAQVVSCNTHGIAAILQALGGPMLQGVGAADFVVVRRSEDIGKSERLVGASVVARHRDPERGTHHAADVQRLFAEIGLEPRVLSSDVTTPTQLMHALRFRVQARSPQAAVAAFRNHPWIAVTQRFDSDAIFERGRRTGFEGRVWAQAVVVENNLMAVGDDVIGWAFVPQECNTIPSTIHSWLLQTDHPEADVLMSVIRRELAVEEI